MAVNKLLLSAIFLLLYRKHCDCTFPVIIFVTATFVLHSCVANIYVLNYNYFFRLDVDSQVKKSKARLGITVFILSLFTQPDSAKYA